MQTDRQIDPNLFTAALHHWHHAGSRQRNATARQGQTFAVHDDLQGLTDIVEIIKRLAHAHHDDVGNAPFTRTGGPVPKVVAGYHQLADDLTRR